jgi:hypothetical protein
VKVPHSKEAANHAVPESCVLYREVHIPRDRGHHCALMADSIPN